MSLPDPLMGRYFLLTTGWHPDRVDEVTGALAAGDLKPVDAKRLLARTVVDLYHGDGAGEEGEAAFDRVFRSHDAPDEIPEQVVDAAAAVEGRIRLATVLHQCGLVQSNREGARMIQQGAVRLDGEPVTDPDLAVPVADLDGVTVQVGKRRWARLRVDPGS
jgi:tyrosyl-tRNA synthetase